MILGLLESPGERIGEPSGDRATQLMMGPFLVK
jgi:hypothetical protein